MLIYIAPLRVKSSEVLQAILHKTTINQNGNPSACAIEAWKTERAHVTDGMMHMILFDGDVFCLVWKQSFIFRLWFISVLYITLCDTIFGHWVISECYFLLAYISEYGHLCFCYHVEIYLFPMPTRVNLHLVLHVKSEQNNVIWIKINMNIHYNHTNMTKWFTSE